MKSLFLLLILFCCGSFLRLNAQDTTKVKVLGKNFVTVVDGKHGNQVKVGKNSVIVKEGEGNDSVKVRVGHKVLVISDGKNGSNVEVSKLNDKEYEKWTERPARFKGHWGAFEMGFNSFTKVNYSGFVPNFMDLNQSKSLETGLNLICYSIGLQKVKRNTGVVTGLGLTYNDYRFSNPYTITNVDGLIGAFELDATNLTKTKLSTIFLTVPLLLEFQIPVNDHDRKIYFSGGLIGGAKVGSHIKVIQNSHKNKHHDDYNINPFRYGATARIGYKGLNLFGTYYFSTFFKSGRGPEMFPFTIGIGLINW